MREILFRGKQKDNGEWIEGYYACESNHACFKAELKHHHYIWKDVFMDWNLGGLEQYEIFPETVGQYTGLTDKNGKRIFEGDIVNDKYGNTLVVCYGKHTIRCCGCCYDLHQSCGFCLVHAEYANEEGALEEVFSDAESWEELTVIGNVHDNSELLKGGKGDD